MGGEGHPCVHPCVLHMASLPETPLSFVCSHQIPTHLSNILSVLLPSRRPRMPTGQAAASSPSSRGPLCGAWGSLRVPVSRDPRLLGSRESVVPLKTQAGRSSRTAAHAPSQTRSPSQSPASPAQGGDGVRAEASELRCWPAGPDGWVRTGLCVRLQALSGYSLATLLPAALRDGPFL